MARCSNGWSSSPASSSTRRSRLEETATDASTRIGGSTSHSCILLCLSVICSTTHRCPRLIHSRVLPAVFGSPSARVPEPRVGCRPRPPRGRTIIAPDRRLWRERQLPSRQPRHLPYRGLRNMPLLPFSPGFGCLRGASAGALFGSEWRPPLCIRAASALALRSDSACLRALPAVRQGHHVDGDAVSESLDGLGLRSLPSRCIRAHPASLTAPARPPPSGPSSWTSSRSHSRTNVSRRRPR